MFRRKICFTTMHQSVSGENRHDLKMWTTDDAGNKGRELINPVFLLNYANTKVCFCPNVFLQNIIYYYGRSYS